VFLNHQYSIQTAQPDLLKGKDCELFNLFGGLATDQYELTVELVQVSITGSAGDDASDGVWLITRSYSGRLSS